MDTLARRLDAASADLRSLGAQPLVGRFVCPLCLRGLPVSAATLGHYPAASAPARQRRTELLCESCNSYLGRTYEAESALLLARQWRVRMQAERGGHVDVRARIEQRDHVIEIRPVRAGSDFGGRFRAMRARASDPGRLMLQIHQPPSTVVERTLLAWSFLDWFYYAGYRYVASNGARAVRRLLLDGSTVAPAGLYCATGPVQVPLSPPEPAVLLAARRADIGATPAPQPEFVALATTWGGPISVLPFASDPDERAWRRVSELIADASTILYTRPLRSFFAEVVSRGFISRGLRSDVHISDSDTGLDVWLTSAVSTAEAQALVEDRSLMRLPVDRGPRLRTTRVLDRTGSH